MAHRVTFVCDTCEKQFMVTEEMDMPPHWFALQLALSDKDGLIPPQERDVFSHFCSQECASQFVGSNEVRERSLIVDKDVDDESDPDNDDNDVPGDYEQ